MGNEAVRHVTLHRIDPTPVDTIVRDPDLQVVPGHILEERVAGSLGDGQDTARLVQSRSKTVVIIGCTDEAKARIVGIIARVDNPVEIMNRDHQRSVESSRRHVEWRVEDIEVLPAEKRA